MKLEILELTHFLKTMMTTAEKSLEVEDLSDAQCGFWKGRFETANEVLEYVQKRWGGKKIYQCHLCNRVLGAELIPCPDCHSGMKDAMRLFEITKGMTKEEAERYGKSLLKLSKPTGRNIWKGGQRMKLDIETLQEYQELKRIIQDAIIFYEQKYDKHINTDHLEIEIFNHLTIALKWLERIKNIKFYGEDTE